jgi:hypothetical protein
MYFRLLNLFVLLAATLVGAQSISNVIPTTNMPAAGTFQGIAGVPGGIDQYSTNYTMFCNVRVFIPGTTNVAYGDGIHDDSAAINFAIKSATNGSYVYIPAGTYLLQANGLYRQNPSQWDGIIHPFSIILRGDGMGQTVLLNNSGSEAIFLNKNSGWTGLKLTNAPSRGANSLTTVGTFPGNRTALNQWVEVFHDNATANVYLPPANDPHPYYVVYGNSACQSVRVTNIVGNTIYFTPPLNECYSNSTISVYGNPPLRCGIEDLTVVQMKEANRHNIRINGGQECWIRNVESRQARGYHISVETSANCEVRRCYVHEPFPNKNGANGGGGSDYGICLGLSTTGTLVEDNIALHCRHSFIIETGAGQNNVVAYNYGKDNLHEQLFTTDWQEDTAYHGGEPRFCLWEGNVVPIIEADGVEGATRFNTFFRNLVTRDGLPSVKYFMWAMDIDRGNYYDYFVNNVYLPCTANVTPVYAIGHWQTDLVYTDTNVLATCVWFGNLDLATNKVDYTANATIFWTNAVAAVTNASMIYDSKPAWFGGNVWPPIGRDVPGYNNPIPAQTRALAIPGFTNVVKDGYQLAVANANGTITVAGNSSYFNGAWVALSAVPNTNYTFVNWTGGAVANPNTPNTYLIMPASNLSVTANFVAGPNYDLTVINGTGTGSYASGASVTISATPPVGQQFQSWIIPALNLTTNVSTLTITMPAASLTAMATFTNIPVRVPLLPPTNLRVQ